MPVRPAVCSYVLDEEAGVDGLAGVSGAAGFAASAAAGFVSLGDGVSDAVPDAVLLDDPPEALPA